MTIPNGGRNFLRLLSSDQFCLKKSANICFESVSNHFPSSHVILRTKGNARVYVCERILQHSTPEIVNYEKNQTDPFVIVEEI